MEDIQLNKINDYLWEIPKHGGMNVPARVYTSSDMIEDIKQDKALEQLANVAYLPGIQKYSIAMPDIHWGYGFPIGGVAAIDTKTGVISPGGVGYDINCGVRLLSTNLDENSVKPKIGDLLKEMFHNIPCGLGISGKFVLNEGSYKELISKGVKWIIEKGWGDFEDLLHIEDKGFFEGGNIENISSKALNRGKDQLGTLGSGNHFLEIDVVDKIYLPETAKKFGLCVGQVCVLIHCGSRGFGHQICNDYIDTMISYMEKKNLKLPDKQLACAHIESDVGKSYLSAFAAAVNYAWANRQIIMEEVRKSFSRIIGISKEQLSGKLVYDVSHNIAKFEDHDVDGIMKQLCVHRKGATRALPKGHELLPEAYRDIGQPIFIPGDMGRGSFVLVGGEKSTDTFYTCCHGAGRVLSRRKAQKLSKGKNIVKEMEEKGVTVFARGKRTLMEEIPEAYKDAEAVCNVVENAGIANKVAKLRPIGVLKG